MPPLNLLNRYLHPALMTADAATGGDAGAAPPPSGDTGGGSRVSEAEMYGQTQEQPGQKDPEPPMHVWKVNGDRPEWLPEKFVGKDGTVDLSKVFESYSNLESKMSTRNDHLRTQIMDELRAEIPEEYDTAVELPDGFEFQPDPEDPLYATAVEVAKEAGMNQEQFSKLMQSYVDHMASMMPDHQEELQKLGENGQARIEAAMNWMNANMPKGLGEWFEGVADSAEAVEFIEWVQQRVGEPSQNGGQAGTNQPVQAGKTEAELRTMMKDPRYWDPNKRDPAWIAEIDRGFQRLYG